MSRHGASNAFALAGSGSGARPGGSGDDRNAPDRTSRRRRRASPRLRRIVPLELEPADLHDVSFLHAEVAQAALDAVALEHAVEVRRGLATVPVDPGGQA